MGLTAYRVNTKNCSFFSEFDIPSYTFQKSDAFITTMVEGKFVLGSGQEQKNWGDHRSLQVTQLPARVEHI
jgi:hypothetical protein